MRSKLRNRWLVHSYMKGMRMGVSICVESEIGQVARESFVGRYRASWVAHRHLFSLSNVSLILSEFSLTLFYKENI